MINNLSTILENLRSGKINNLECLLPVCIILDNKPMTLVNYFPFKPLFNVNLPKRFLIKSGRQIGKTTSISAMCLIRCFSIPSFKVMILAPLKSQVINISNTYIKQFVNRSPLKKLFIDGTCKQGTLYRDFLNGSRIAFLYAQEEADRTRSYTNDMLLVDEVQAFDLELLPVIRETLTASDWRIQVFTGTPLSLDNTIETLWQESSQCEWVIKCQSCNLYNIPSIDHHILKMIGPMKDDISEDNPATICANCGKPISPRLGQWIPRYKDRMESFPGYHIPQIILPMHYANSGRWQELLEKREGKGPTPWFSFVNEVLGESCDIATAMLSPSDLLAVSQLDKNSLTNLMARRHDYSLLVMAIDWGGGGSEGLSYTTVAFIGLRHDGILEVPYGIRYMQELDYIEEAKKLAELYRIVNPDYIVHDYTGAGGIREIVMVGQGVPMDVFVPMYLVSTSTNYLIVPVDKPGKHRLFYKIDKTRGYQITIGAIRAKQVLFFNNGLTEEGQNLLNDFLSLCEEKKYTQGDREIYRIIKRRRSIDDFAAAVMIGSCFIWNYRGEWPILDDIGRI